MNESLTLKLARRIDWCHVVRGTVHVASWTSYGEGCLTTMWENPKTGETEHLHQTPTTFQELRESGRPWRDRKLLGRVCSRCERELQEEQDIIEVTRG